jgi:hypothetical protein
MIAKTYKIDPKMAKMPKNDKNWYLSSTKYDLRLNILKEYS